jgi:hypothetical protein
VPLNGGDNRGGFLQHNLRVDIKQPAYQYKKELRYLYKKKATSIALNKFEMYNNNKVSRWRAGEMVLKEFYKLSAEDKRIYVESIIQIPVEHQSDTDEYIIQFFYKKKSKQFLDITEQI